CCDLRAEQARAQNPDRYFETCARHGAYRRRALEVGHELEDVLREGVRIRRQIAPERAGSRLIRSGCASQTEVDAARIERLERAELLRDHERRMIRQHDAARADPNR